LATLLAITLGRTGTAAAEASVERGSVFTEPVRRGDFVRKVPVSGVLVPEHVEWLSATTPARVAKIAVRAGAPVSEDTIVVVLANPELELAALEAEQRAASAESQRIQLDVRTESERRLQGATLVGLRSQLEDADRHAFSAERLAKEGLLGEIERRDAVSKKGGLTALVAAEEGRKSVLDSGRDRQLGAQSAEVARLREIAAFRKKQLASLEVRAGIRGIVQDVPLETGQWVAAGAVLAKIAEPERLRAEVKVAEASAKDVRKGAKVRFESPAGVEGIVERIDPSASAGTVKVVVSLVSVPKGARADQGVSGNIEIETMTDVVFVARPSGARENAACSVFKLDADGAFATRTPVRLGRGSTREIEVESGLAPGDRVIVSDTSSWDSAKRIRIR